VSEEPAHVADALRPLLDAFRRGGDAAAMERLVASTRPRLLAVARRIGSREDAEDSVQAAYHALLSRAAPPDAPIVAWLLTAVVRIAYRRKAMARRELEIARRLARARSEDSPLERASRADAGAFLRRQLERLPALYRDPIVLHHLEGLSIAEVSRLLDAGPSTVTTRLQRGRALLRSRVPPALLHPLLAVPWFFADFGRAVGGSKALAVGGVMNAKATILFVAVGVTAGTLGLAVGKSGGAGGGESPPRADAAAARREARLVADIAARDQEIATLRRKAQEPRRPVAGDPAAPDPKRASPSPSAGPKIAIFEQNLAFFEQTKLDPAKAREVAHRLGASEAALEVALRALRSLGNAADPSTQKESLEALARLGDERAPAVAAVVSALDGSGFLGEWFPRLLQAASVPGQEHRIVDLLKDDTTSSWLKSEIVRIADALDSEAMRSYLVERLGAEQDPYMFANIAFALGRMKEARAVPACVRELRRGGDRRPFEPGLLFALGGMGGREAETALLQYLDRPELEHAGDAVRALARIDPTEAARRARQILEGARAGELSKPNRELLEEAAGRTSR